MKRWWKGALALCALAAGLLLLAGCMSAEDRARAEANVHVGRVLVKQYVEEVCGEPARILEIECPDRVNEPGIIPDFGRYPSDFVRARVRAGGEEFDVLVNVETEEGFDNRRHREILESIHPYFSGRMAELPTPRKIEAHYYPQPAQELPASVCDGFSEPGIGDFAALLEADGYDAFVLYDYVERPLDFLQGAEERLIPTDRAIGDLQLGFASFRDEDSFSALSETMLGGPEMAVRLAEQNALIRETCLLKREKDNSTLPGTEAYMGPVKTEHHRYARLELEQGIEVVYDEDLYDVSVSEAAAEDPAFVWGREEFSGAVTPAYTLHITAKRQLEFEEAQVLLYFPESLKGHYLVTDDGEEEDWNLLSWRRGHRRLYYWFRVTDGWQEATFALYQDRTDPDAE